MYCINCGARIEENQKFCSECGTMVQNKSVNSNVSDVRCPPVKQQKENSNNFGQILNKVKSFIRTTYSGVKKYAVIFWNKLSELLNKVLMWLQRKIKTIAKSKRNTAIASLALLFIIAAVGNECK